MDSTTRQKARYIEDHGYEVTGYILTHPESGKRCFIEHGRVVWLEQEDAELALGHRQPETDNPENYPATKRYTLTEGATRSNIKTPKPDGRRPPPPPPPIPPPNTVFKEEMPGTETVRTIIRVIREWRHARKED